MAYDDEESLKRDFEDYVILFERYLTSPENLTISRLIALTRAVHRIAGGRGVEDISMAELARELRERGLGTVPFDTVVGVLEITGPLGAQEDVLDRVTLRQIRSIIGR